MKMVGAIIIGVQKCGTTTLANWLDQHSGVRLCDQKEPDFFSKNPDWKDRLDIYHCLYGGGNEGGAEKLWVEASTSYSWFLEYPETAKRLFDYNRQLKLMFIVREPIERIKSHYRHNFLKGHTKRPFSEAVIEEPEYLAHSSYEVQARPFVNLFGADNILFLKFEDLVEGEDKVLKRLFEFLGLDSNFERENFDMSPQNVSSSLKKVSPIKKYVAPMFRFLPLAWRLRFRKVFYRACEVKIDSSQGLEEQLYQLLRNDIEAFYSLTGIDYRR